jgi:hypothetical protein
MNMKSIVSTLILFVALMLPVSAQIYDLNKVVGTYLSSAPQDYVFVKKLTIEKEDNGKVKFRATLSGFPDDFYLGEATAESYTARTTAANRTYLTTFSTSKVTVFMVIGTFANSTAVIVTSYMKYADGRTNVYFDGSLQKESEKPAK